MKNNIVIAHKYLYDFNFIDKPKRFNDLMLYQLGEIHCDENSVVEEHCHDDFFELTFVISGSGEIRAEGVSQKIKKNDLFLSLPNETHEIVSDKLSPLRYYYIAFSFDTDSEYRHITLNCNLLNVPSNARISNSLNLAHDFNNLISAFESRLPYSNIKFEMLVKVLFLNVLNLYGQAPNKEYSSPVVDTEQNLYYKIINYIDHNLLSITHLTEIADHLNYTYIYISRIFKKQFGKSIYTYYSDRKLDFAKQLIEEKKMSVTEIAEFLNYSSIYVFSRIFKKRFGISPNDYRTKILKNKSVRYHVKKHK